MRMKSGKWNVNNGELNAQVTSDELKIKYKINHSYNIFPNNKKLLENTRRHEQQRRDKKAKILKTISEQMAEELQDKMLAKEYADFMENAGISNAPHYIIFKEKLMKKIEEPSMHTVQG